MNTIRTSFKQKHREVFLEFDLNKRFKEQTIKSKKLYSRKDKHKKIIE